MRTALPEERLRARENIKQVRGRSATAGRITKQRSFAACRSREVARALEPCVGSFKRCCPRAGRYFPENMEKNNLAGDDIPKYQFGSGRRARACTAWEAVRAHERRAVSGDAAEYYDARIADGLPGKTSTPWRPSWRCPIYMNTPATRTSRRGAKGGPSGSGTAFPKQREGGFQHITSDTLNDGELWDDTLSMTVLVLANMGRILGRQDYTDEAAHQFCCIRNIWLTKQGCGIMGLRSMATTTSWAHSGAAETAGHHRHPAAAGNAARRQPARRILVNALENQIAPLAKYQDGNGNVAYADRRP